MSPESRRVAGIVFIVLPTVMFGGVSILRLLMGDPDYMANPPRQDLWRAGHAHAGVLLILSLVAGCPGAECAHQLRLSRRPVPGHRGSHPGVRPAALRRR
jgi:hypothetical protein